MWAALMRGWIAWRKNEIRSVVQADLGHPVVPPKISIPFFRNL
jgi:hypothetical protein